MSDLLFLLVGGVLLYFGAEWLVAGSAGLALSLRIPRLVVGLTVVAYGTSAPEVIVSARAAITGDSAIALGNVIGSNIANLGLILGIATLVRPARVDGTLRRRELPALAASTLAVPVVLADGVVTRLEGALLLTAGVVYTVLMVRAARDSRTVAEALHAAEDTEDAATHAGAPQARSRVRLAALATVGLAVLVLGGHMFVTGAKGAARALGMSDRVVGLTVVAIGTSLPELATSLVAASRGHSDIAVGNVVGSNLFNVVLCLGIAAVIAPIQSPVAALMADLVAFVGLSVAGLIFLRTERTMRRWEGAVLLAGYTLSILWVLHHG